MNSTKKSSQYQRERAIAENQYATLSVGRNLKTRQVVLIRDFKPAILSSESQWAGFRQLLEELRQTQVIGMLRVAGIAGSLTQPYLVISGTTGQSLRNALARLETPELAELVQSLKTAARGLDSLHETGYVHGDVRPEALFFDAEGNLLLNELTTHYALCGWGQGAHVMDPRYFGSVFPTGYLAPEVRSGGPLTERTDQYALGLILLEICTGIPPRENVSIQDVLAGANVSPSVSSQVRKLRPVLERALSPDPQKRYPNCQAMLEDAEERLTHSSAKKWVALGLGAAAVLSALGLLFSWLSAGKGTPEEGEWKSAAIQAIERQYQREIPLVPSVTAKIQASPTETTAVGPILDDIRSKLADQQLGALKSQLRKVSLDVLAEPNSPSFQFLYSHDSTEILYLDSKSETAWKAVLEFTGELPEQELNVRVELYDVDKGTMLAQVPMHLEGPKPPTPAGKLAWNAETRRLTVDLGKVSAPKPMGETPAKWAAGMGLGVRVSIDTSVRQIWWNKSPTYQVGELVRVNRQIVLSPSEVRKQGFQVDTGIALSPGQEFRIQAKGRIQPGTEGSYLVMTGKKDRVPIDPYGLAITSTGNTKHYPVSHDNKQPIEPARWGALIMKVGGDSDWKWPFNAPRQGDLNELLTADTSGHLLLSIDSVKYIDNRILKRDRVRVSDDRFWQSPEDGGGQFGVTIQTIQLLPDGLPEEISRILLDRHGQLAEP